VNTYHTKFNHSHNGLRQNTHNSLNLLPNCQIPELAGQHTDYYSADSPELCSNIQHFRAYPHHIDYKFNSRGFRDQEWPQDLAQLQTSIWCIGDSATVGVANPLEHTWVHLLGQRTGRRTINVSMTGASNTWIARKACEILQEIKPQHVVIQWSYFSRRESINTTRTELDRQLQHDSVLELSRDVDHFKQCLNQVELVKGHTVVVHSVVPDAFAGISVKEIRGWWYTHRLPHWPDQTPRSWAEITDLIKKELDKKDLLESFYWHYHMQDFMQQQEIVLLDQLHENFERERARDSLHYDIKTATIFVDQIWKRLL
jgi:hypothetical protein